MHLLYFRRRFYRLSLFFLIFPLFIFSGSQIKVSISSQRLYLYENANLACDFPISSAKNGLGSKAGTYQTPKGKHKISRKFGAGAKKWTIFKGGINTRRLWDFQNKNDLILTRVFMLEGLEPGINRGRNRQGENVDSYERGIFIHGTNHEDLIGTEASLGCIRMKNDDIITLFDKVPEGTLVEITY